MKHDDTLPALADACRLSVVVPARNEEDLLGRALAALAAQRDGTGAPLDPRTYEIVVLCNNCDDGTPERARRFAAAHPERSVHVLVRTYPAERAHVGTARRDALDIVARRYAAAGRPRGALASTDADSEVDPRWVAATLAELEGVDAVAGHVSVLPAERDRMLVPLRARYDRECTYRRLLGHVEAAFDPRPYDRAPRHDAFVGASFAVTASAYAAAGGLPPLPRLEDLAFARALERIDARIRHTYAVRVHTSARHAARVAGGFGSFVAELAAGGARGTFLVQNARGSVEEARARAALRAGFLARDPIAFSDAADLLGLEEARVAGAAARAPAFGALWQELRSESAQARYPDEPVEDAIAALRAALAENAARPTRERIASGAG